MIAALCGDEIGPPGGDAGELDGSLDSLRAGIGEEVSGQPSWSDRGDLAQQLGADVAVEALVPGGQGYAIARSLRRRTPGRRDRESPRRSCSWRRGTGDRLNRRDRSPRHGRGRSPAWRRAAAGAHFRAVGSATGQEYRRSLLTSLLVLQMCSGTRSPDRRNPLIPSARPGGHPAASTRPLGAGRREHVPTPRKNRPVLTCLTRGSGEGALRHVRLLQVPQWRGVRSFLVHRARPGLDWRCGRRRRRRGRHHVQRRRAQLRL